MDRNRRGQLFVVGNAGEGLVQVDLGHTERREADARRPSAVLAALTISEAAASVAPSVVDGSVLVVHDRLSETPTRSPGDLVGTIDVSELRRLAAGAATASDRVADHAAGPLVTVGAGESVSDAAARLGDGVGVVGVLVNGRVAALLASARLKRADA